MSLVSGGGTNDVALISLCPISANIVDFFCFDSVKKPLHVLSWESDWTRTSIKCACARVPQVAPVMPLSYKHLREGEWEPAGEFAQAAARHVGAICGAAASSTSGAERWGGRLKRDEKTKVTATSSSLMSPACLQSCVLHNLPRRY